VHTVSQWPNLRPLAEPLGGAVGLLETVSFKEAIESVCKCWKGVSYNRWLEVAYSTF